MKNVYLVSRENVGDNEYVVAANEKAAQRQMLHWVKARRAIFDVPVDITDEEALRDWYEFTGCNEYITYEVMPVIS